jgi:hypothetical protein
LSFLQDTATDAAIANDKIFVYCCLVAIDKLFMAQTYLGYIKQLLG